MKNPLISTFVYCLTLLFSANILAETSSVKHSSPQALIKTNYGNIVVDLFDQQAPKTVANFKQYADRKFYDGTVFHRVIPNFMIQGGGMDKNLAKKPTEAPIVNEASPSVPNLRGTLAMARTNDPHSATSQFFINVVDNHFLNKSSNNPGYAVFGKVIEGMDIADKIAAVQTVSKGYMRDIPKTPVEILSISISQPKE